MKYITPRASDGKLFSKKLFPSRGNELEVRLKALQGNFDAQKLESIIDEHTVVPIADSYMSPNRPWRKGIGRELTPLKHPSQSFA